jgi:hypothetical protein
MTKVAFSGGEQSLATIWQWYEAIQAALNSYQRDILNALFQGQSVNEPFLFMTKEDVLDYFVQQKTELEHLVSLNMMASVEAAIRIDYLKRVYARKKDSVSRRFRELHKKKGVKASLEEDILKIWKQEQPSCKTAIDQFQNASKLRHWLAHGRYWTPKLGRNYNLNTIFDIAKQLLNELQISQ